MIFTEPLYNGPYTPMTPSTYIALGIILGGFALALGLYLASKWKGHK